MNNNKIELTENGTITKPDWIKENWRKLMVWMVKNQPWFINTIFKWRKRKFDRAIQRFVAITQKELDGSLIIVANPKDDQVVASYRGLMINNQIRDKDGLNRHLIKKLMQFSKTKDSMDNFLLLVDGMVYNLAKSYQLKKKGRFLVNKENQ